MTLKMELEQDIVDNGMLDCLRVVEAPHSYLETEDERNKRIASQWDSQCSFETKSDYMKSLRDIYQIQNLVDVSGEIVENDFDNQADMCEIIRAAIAGGKMQKITSDVQNIPESILDLIECAGSDKQSQLCAVNNESFFNKKGWTLLLGAMNININKKVRFTKVEKEELEKSDNDSEEDKQMQKQLEESSQKDKLEEEENEEDDQMKLLMLWMGNDSKYKTERPSCDDFATMKTYQLLKSAELKADQIKKMTLFVMANIVGNMRALKNKRIGGHLQAILSAKGKDLLETQIEIGPDQSFAISTGFMYNANTLQDFQVQMKVQGDAKYTCDLDSDSISMFILGVNNKDYKYDEMKVEKDFELKVKELEEAKSGEDDLEKKDKSKSKKEKKPEGEIQQGKVDQLIIKKKMENMGHVLIFYKLGVAIDATLTTQIMVDGEEHKISRFVSSHRNSSISTHNNGLMVTQLKEGDREILISYQVKAAGQKFDQKPNAFSNAYLGVMDLPEDVKILQKTISEDLVLSSKQWVTIDDLNIQFKNDKPVNLLIIYNLIGLLESKGQVISTRVTINDKEIIMARSRSNDYDIIQEKQFLISQSFLSLRGQAVFTIKLKSPNNKISLEYKINQGSVTISKDNSDGETANIIVMQSQMIELKPKI